MSPLARRQARLLIVACATVLATFPIVHTPAAAHELVLPVTGPATNGVVRSAVTQFSHNHCGVYSDVELVVFYDRATATQFRVTKVRVNYWVKGSGNGVWGGTMKIMGAGGSSYLPAGSQLGDHWSFYRYDPATRDIEGYSHAGSYTHWGPLTVTPVTMSDGRRYARIWKRTNVESPRCVGSWDYSEMQLRWTP
jgi:hypothetical protein